jgi:4-hydroxyphenylacetate 3-hydroxylase, reductase component
MVALTQAAEQASFDARFFRRCLGQFATGVTLVTTEASGKCYGLTANSFSSVSIEPPLISWAIGRRSRSFEVFRAAKYFNVHILSTSQINISQHFSGAAEDKFQSIEFSYGASGAPVLPNPIALIECQQETAIDAGDHAIIVGRVLRLASEAGEPLIFAQGRYCIAVDHPALKIDETPKVDHDSLPEVSPLFRLLFGAFHAMVDKFDVHRAEAGLTVIQLRVLVGATDVPGTTLSSLVKRMRLTTTEAQDALSELIDRGDLRKDEEGQIWPTDAGMARRKNMIERVFQFEEELLRGIPPHQIAAARQVLTQLIIRNPGVQ